MHKGKFLWSVVRVGCTVALVLTVAAAWTACSYAYRATSKERLPHAEDTPQPVQRLGPPEVQFEQHTCGLHALALIYRAHGLDPERERLRERLGVDVPAIEGEPGTTGTLHPDLLRVLRQDHFDARCLDLERKDAAPALQSFVSAGHPALILIALPDSEVLHWVAAGNADEAGRLRIYNSLVREPYDVELDEYLARQALSVVTIAADANVQFVSAKATYSEGLAEMWRVWRRLNARAQ
jgi:hypothetical protein